MRAFVFNTMSLWEDRCESKVTIRAKLVHGPLAHVQKLTQAMLGVLPPTTPSHSPHGPTNVQLYLSPPSSDVSSVSPLTPCTAHPAPTPHNPSHAPLGVGH